MLRLYNTALLPMRLVSALWSLWARRDPARAREWAERRASILPEVPAGAAWIHGSSVGEARLVTLLARRLRSERPTLPVCVSCYTPTGRSQLPSPPDVDAAFYLPLDFPGYPGRVLEAVRPAALILIETELWPNLLAEASALEVPVVLVNGRLSAERMSRYGRLRRLYAPLLAGLARVGAQTREDADRFTRLGVRESSLEITGNVKYDLPLPDVRPERLRQRFGIPAHRPVVVAGSTGAGEEAQVLDAFLEARAVHDALFLVLAPRHPERAAEVAREVEKRQLRLHPLSSGDPEQAGRTDGLLVDTVGELAALYGLALAAFVGGSLVPVGGHNLLEPAAAGVPVLFGPHTHHVTEPAETLIRAGGALRVADVGELAAAWTRLVANEDERRAMARRAEGVVRANRGALARSAALVLSVLEAGGAGILERS